MEIEEVLANHERRLKKLEKMITPSSKPKLLSKPTSGLQRGVQDMVTDGFFDKPRSVSEARLELESKGIFRDIRVIDTAIRRDFFKKKKMLTRVKDGTNWKYVKQ